MKNPPTATAANTAKKDSKNTRTARREPRRRAAASASPLSFAWVDVAPDRPAGMFRVFHRFKAFSDRFFLAFGPDVPLEVDAALLALLAGKTASCKTFAQRQFWLGLCIYAARFESLAEDPNTDRGEMERATDRATKRVERFKTQFPDLWLGGDERAFLAAFDLDLHAALRVELDAPRLAALDKAPTGSSSNRAAGDRNDGGHRATGHPRRQRVDWTTADLRMATAFLSCHPYPKTKTGSIDARSIRGKWGAVWRDWGKWLQETDGRFAGSQYARRANGIELKDGDGKKPHGVKDVADLRSLLSAWARNPESR